MTAFPLLWLTTGAQNIQHGRAVRLLHPASKFRNAHLATTRYFTTALFRNGASFGAENFELERFAEGVRCVENRTNSDYEDLPGRRSLLSKFTPENIGEKLRRAMLSARPARQVVAEPRRRGSLILALVLMAVAIANGDDAKLSQAQRVAIIRSLLAERPFVHRAFPMGKSGIRIEGDKITPLEAEMNQTIGHYGAAAKPGERVRITAVRFEHHGISLDINGGPTRRKSWKDRINVGVKRGRSGRRVERVWQRRSL